MMVAKERKKTPRCPGHGRHWFTIHGVVGLRTPRCIRCGTPNPKPLTNDEWAELEAFSDQNWRLGKYNEEALRVHREENK
jgi:hypothetical protein